MKIGFIGGGHMCEALIQGILLSKTLDAKNIYVSTLENERRKHLNDKYGINTELSNKDLTSKVDVLLVSVKPADVFSVCDEIKDVLQTETLLASVAGGITTTGIAKKLNHNSNIARIMPNIPSCVCSGTVAVYFHKSCNKNIADKFRNFAKCWGYIFEITEEESLMDVVNVISASTPAYYIMLMDELVKYAVSQGLNENDAKQIILNTMKGSAQWALAVDDNISNLWTKVATGGGTTAVGIDVFKENKLTESFIDGINKAVISAKDRTKKYSV